MATKHCFACHQTRAEGAVFGRLAETGKLDDYCVKCRFACIDNTASDDAAIRQDMRLSGIPARGQNSH